jgi:hypothetical protein
VDSAAALLTAVQALLKANAPLTDLVGQRVYGKVPADVTYPYVYISCTSAPDSTDDTEDMEHTLRVQGFSRETKPGTALAIRKLVYAALNRKEDALVLSDGEVVMIEHEGITECFPEPDGRTTQSIIEFKVKVN